MHLRLPAHGPATSVEPYHVAPFIIKGYRHVSCASESLLSSFTLCNEFLNIWTHFAGTLLFTASLLALLAEAWTWETGFFVRESYLPLLLQQLGSVVVMAASTVAHTFGSQSAQHQRTLFVVDNLAIGFYCTSSSAAHLAYSRPSAPGAGPVAAFSAAGFMAAALGAHLLVFGVQCYVRCSRRSSPHRTSMVAVVYSLAYLVNFLPFASRYGDGERLPSDGHHWRQFCWGAMSAVVVAAQVPERWAPEWFYVLHSHAIMHVTMICSVLEQRTALAMDLRLRPPLPEALQPTAGSIAAVMAGYVVIGGVVAYCVSSLRVRSPGQEAGSAVLHRKST